MKKDCEILRRMSSCSLHTLPVKPSEWIFDELSVFAEIESQFCEEG